MKAPHDLFTDARDFLLAHRGDPVAAARDFHWPRFTQFNWALDYFDVMAAGNDAPALWIVGEDGSEHRQSFRELSSRSAQVANHLRSLGVARGDRILLMLGNEPPLWETMLAAMKLGAVVIPATALLTPDDLRDRIDRGRVRHVVASNAHIPKFADVGGTYTRICSGPAQSGWVSHDAANRFPTAFTPDAPTQASDPLLLYFTSGTTSKPKLVLHTHESYPVGHLTTMYWLGLAPGDIHLNISSPGWAKHSWSCVFAPWNAGACVFIYNSARFDAGGLLQTVARCKVTTLCAPPTVWRLLIQDDLGTFRGRLGLRELASAGEPLNPEVIEQVRTAWGITIRDGYGQTETTAVLGNPPGQPLRPGSMGRPLPGYRVVLLDLNGVPADEGEVCLELDPRPTGLMAGYEDSIDATVRATRGGYYHTGDTAARDADGYVTFVGRADDVFKASDYRISPFELESALLEHEAVTEVAIVPSPDALRLAVPKAFVTVTAASTPGRELALDILAFARRQLAPYKRVRRLEFVPELPKTLSGKIRRVELRQNEAALRQRGGRAELEFFEEDFPHLKRE
jgi:acetyl-CoA synthetase